MNKNVFRYVRNVKCINIINIIILFTIILIKLLFEIKLFVEEFDENLPSTEFLLLSK